MATKPLTNEAIALAEKKMNMTLDDIIKMSQAKTSKSGMQMASNNNRRFSNGTHEKDMFLKPRQYMHSRSRLSQGVLAQKRSTFRGKNFSLAPGRAQKAPVMPFYNRVTKSNRAASWNKPRPAGPMWRRGNLPLGGNTFKRQQRYVHTSEAMRRQNPKTLDSLFADMKENRMQGFTQKRNAGAGYRPRQPWLRGRFGYY